MICKPLARCAGVIWPLALAMVLCTAVAGWPAERMVQPHHGRNGEKLLESALATIRIIEGRSGSNSEQMLQDNLSAHYFLGIMEALTDFGSAWKFCLPQTYSPIQLTRAVVHVLQANPRLLSMHMTEAFAVAMYRTFPCSPER